MKKNVDVTVVIPFYNRAAYATRLLNSIFKQTVAPQAVFFVDNGSIDSEISNLNEIIANFSSANIDIRCISTERKGNANIARNLGAQYANTKYVAFLDSDDWWNPSHLENSLATLEATGKQAVYSGAVVHYGRNVYTNYSADVNMLPTPFHIFFSKQGYCAQTSSYVIEKEVFSHISWDEGLKRHQDYDLFLTIAYRFGWAFNKLPESNFERSSAISGRNFDIKSMIHFLKKWESKFPDDCLKKYLLSQLELCIISGLNYKYYLYYRLMYLNKCDFSFISKVKSCYFIKRTKISIINFVKFIKIYSLVKNILSR